MNIKETMRMLVDGKKVQHLSWTNSEYIQLNYNGKIIDEDGDIIGYLSQGEYREYLEPIAPKTLWRRPLKYTDGWHISTFWYFSKQDFMDIHRGAASHGPWESMEEPKEVEK